MRGRMTGMEQSVALPDRLARHARKKDDGTRRGLAKIKGSRRSPYVVFADDQMKSADQLMLELNRYDMGVAADPIRYAFPADIA